MDFGRDLLVVQTSGDELKNLKFPRGQGSLARFVLHHGEGARVGLTEGRFRMALGAYSSDQDPHSLTAAAGNCHAHPLVVSQGSTNFGVKRTGHGERLTQRTQT